MDRELQSYYTEEYAKGLFERLLRSDFDFSRSITEVHPPHSFAARLLRRVEDHYLEDFILVDANNQRVSVLNDSPDLIQRSETVTRLNALSGLKRAGKRIFFICQHEGYVGPYSVRSALQRLGFSDLAGRCNTIVGPRMRSNVVLKLISGNSGNTFLVLPSSKTKAVKNRSLEKALQACSRRTLALIKLPREVLEIIEDSDFDSFMRILPKLKDEAGRQGDSSLKEHLSTLSETLYAPDFHRFKRIMHEPYLIFPEGTRSLVDRHGDVTLKYFSPRYIASYMRPGDILVPLSLVGGSDALQGIRFRHARFGLNVGESIQITQETLTHSEWMAVHVMKKVAALPNIKNVYFSEEIQFAKTQNNKKSTLKQSA